ncbi:hypothetical protein CAPTEDRAFT_210419 [Capitella teleta]|uniref:Uncharacterized protein n=1 Tax=Capitella teleta TaxID=283909 RepID=N1PBC1_CAPTE|nr:hypothetical protein CAPTEDRAFT_210419 [Capitella teleta]|eukprot:ELU18935.1 hypothetical protein CAPTEDRAFT_210419 [Capitella teleta]
MALVAVPLSEQRGPGRFGNPTTPGRLPQSIDPLDSRELGQTVSRRSASSKEFGHTQSTFPINVRFINKHDLQAMAADVLKNNLYERNIDHMSERKISEQIISLPFVIDYDALITNALFVFAFDKASKHAGRKRQRTTGSLSTCERRLLSVSEEEEEAKSEVPAAASAGCYPDRPLRALHCSRSVSATLRDHTNSSSLMITYYRSLGSAANVHAAAFGGLTIAAAAAAEEMALMQIETPPRCRVYLSREASARTRHGSSVLNTPSTAERQGAL